MSAIPIRFGGYQPARSVHTRAARRLGDELKHRLGDRVDFALTENVPANGRKAADLLTMTEGDELDLCYFSSSYLVARVPTLGIFDLPFQFAYREQVYRLCDGEPGTRIAEDVAAATGFTLLGFWDNGIRHISNGHHSIRTPQDCRGLKIRTLDSTLHQRLFRALGFEPMTIDVKDLAAAVATHQVDAQENPLTNLINFRLHDTHRHVTLTGHFIGTALVLCNRRRLAQWPPDVRQAVTEAVAAVTPLQRQEAMGEDGTCLAQLLADDVTVIRDGEFDRAAFVDATAAIRAEAISSAGIDTRWLT